MRYPTDNTAGAPFVATVSVNPAWAIGDQTWADAMPDNPMPEQLARAEPEPEPEPDPDRPRRRRRTRGGQP